MKDYLSHVKNENQKRPSNKDIKQINNNEPVNNKSDKNSKKNKPNDNLKFYFTAINSLIDYYYCYKNNTEATTSQIEEENIKNYIDKIT